MRSSSTEDGLNCKLKASGTDADEGIPDDAEDEAEDDIQHSDDSSTKSGLDNSDRIPMFVQCVKCMLVFCDFGEASAHEECCSGSGRYSHHESHRVFDNKHKCLQFLIKFSAKYDRLVNAGDRIFFVPPPPPVTSQGWICDKYVENNITDFSPTCDSARTR